MELQEELFQKLKYIDHVYIHKYMTETIRKNIFDHNWQRNIVKNELSENDLTYIKNTGEYVVCSIYLSRRGLNIRCQFSVIGDWTLDITNEDISQDILLEPAIEKEINRLFNEYLEKEYVSFLNNSKEEWKIGLARKLVNKT